jgi:hypothetical protein
MDISIISYNLSDMCIRNNYAINKNGSVDVICDVNVPSHYRELPVQFGTVDGSFTCAFGDIKTLKGSPHTVTGNVTLRECKNITSLEHVPQSIGGNLVLFGTNVASLHNLQHICPQLVVGKCVVLPRKVTHLLSLALIPGISQVSIEGIVVDVIHDVFMWQEKLLEMGLVEQAQL